MSDLELRHDVGDVVVGTWAGEKVFVNVTERRDWEPCEIRVSALLSREDAAKLHAWLSAFLAET